MPAPQLFRVPSTPPRRWLSLPVVLFIVFMTIGGGAAFAKQLPPKASDSAVEASGKPTAEPTVTPSETAAAPAEETTTEGAEDPAAETGLEAAGAAGSLPGTTRAERLAAKAAKNGVSVQSHGGPHRGTIKIDGTPINRFPPSNEPHQECSFVVQFFGFPASVPATVTLRVHPPSGSGQVIFQGGTTLQGDPAGGGTDFDGAIPIPNLAQQLSAFDEHPIQGFHVKVTAVAGQTHKSKVFWMNCPALGSITIRKNAVPNSSASFLFRGFFGPFSLVDNGTGNHRRTFGGLAAGVYLIREAEIPAGWEFAGASCSSPSGVVTGALVTITLGAGEDITCTFVNRRLPPPPSAPRGPVLAVTGLSMVPLMALGLSFLISGAVMERAGRRRRDLDPATEEPPDDAMAITDGGRVLPEWEDEDIAAAEARRRRVQTAVVVGGAVVVAAALVAWRMRKRS